MEEVIYINPIDLLLLKWLRKTRLMLVYCCCNCALRKKPLLTTINGVKRIRPQSLVGRSGQQVRYLSFFSLFFFNYIPKRKTFQENPNFIFLLEGGETNA